jgi:hypothetical protein
VKIWKNPLFGTGPSWEFIASRKNAGNLRFHFIGDGKNVLPDA